MAAGANVFENSVSNYRKKFNGLMSELSSTSVVAVAKSYGLSEDTLKSGLENNNTGFQKFCYAYANNLIVGRLSCCTYAAVVAAVAKELGVPYQTFAGFCLQKSSPRYNKDKTDWEAKRAEGVEHPFFATHVYTTVNGIDFEYYNGETSNVDHLDVVPISEGV